MRKRRRLVEVAACGCVGPYRTEVKAKARRGREENGERRGGVEPGRERKTRFSREQ